MADSTDRITPAEAKRDAPARTGTSAYAVSGNGRPTNPDEMRQEIQRTRARLSRTLDDLEQRIIAERRELDRKADELWAKATLKGVRDKLSREPWRSVGIAFAVGYIIAAIRD